MTPPQSQTFLIVGASSGIARPLCSRFAARGWTLVLAGRDASELERMSRDLAVRHGGSFPFVTFDARDASQSRTLVARAAAMAPTPLDGVVVCPGMPPQQDSGLDEASVRGMCDVNFLSVAVILEAAAAQFADRGRGSIAALSSVAGDRGRQSNYVYGATKAALSTYLAGLRNRLQPHGVSVLTIKPGFVDTAMIRGMKTPPSLLVASPDRVAADIERAIVQRRDVVYTPWFWRWIMTIICAIPEPIFKRLRL